MFRVGTDRVYPGPLDHTVFVFEFDVAGGDRIFMIPLLPVDEKVKISGELKRKGKLIKWFVIPACL